VCLKRAQLRLRFDSAAIIGRGNADAALGMRVTPWLYLSEATDRLWESSVKTATLAATAGKTETCFAAASGSTISRNYPLVKPIADNHPANKRLASTMMYEVEMNWNYICTLFCYSRGRYYYSRCLTDQNFSSRTLAERCPCHSC
uniref:SCP domain-containing protein n=1 Tax=Macrostomum lignano TaxID=282301 RepID=A0A1I8G7U5_9PLAT